MRVTLTGLYVADLSSPPSVLFGTQQASSVTVIISDMDATILAARTPQGATAEVVPVLIAGSANSTFAYTSPGGMATCVTPLCEVNAVHGGQLVLLVSGLGTLSTANLVSTVDGRGVRVNAVTLSGPRSYSVTVTVPGAGKVLDAPLTVAFLAVSSSPTRTAYMDLFYRSPPRATSAFFSVDGASISIVFDQRTNGKGSAVACDAFIREETQYALGEGPLCTWSVDGRSMAVMLGEGAFIDVDDGIYVREGVLGSINGVSSLNFLHRVAVEAPAVALPPR